jgi:SH3 domain protein
VKGDQADMKRIIQWLAIMVFCMSGVLNPACAEDIYVTGITDITMRTGAGVDHKIVAMLRSGTKLEIVEFQKDWSNVRTSSGKTGWVLSRFLTKEIPDALVVEALKIKNQDLTTRLDTLAEENRLLIDKNQSLAHIEEEYSKLKQESADFLKLDEKYRQMLEEFERQKDQITSLENSLNNEEKLWFLSGAGVFMVGIFLGLSTRRKKKSSLL